MHAVYAISASMLRSVGFFNIPLKRNVEKCKWVKYCMIAGLRLLGNGATACRLQQPHRSSKVVRKARQESLLEQNSWCMHWFGKRYVGVEQCLYLPIGQLEDSSSAHFWNVGISRDASIEQDLCISQYKLVLALMFQYRCNELDIEVLAIFWWNRSTN